jgi:hypothetical protein
VPVKYTDQEIAALIQEPKPLEEDFRRKFQLKQKPGHKEFETDIKGANNIFRLIFRQSDQNMLDFSCILALVPSESTQLFRLRRYNGKSHEHTNRLENEKFYGFHIHKSTERYQELGDGKEDGFAEQTNRYSNLNEALECMLNDCGFLLSQNGQMDIFDEEQK